MNARRDKCIIANCALTLSMTHTLKRASTWETWLSAMKTVCDLNFDNVRRTCTAAAERDQASSLLFASIHLHKEFVRLVAVNSPFALSCKLSEFNSPVVFDEKIELLFKTFCGTEIEPP